MVSLNQEPTSEEKAAQLARIVNSAVLQNAPVLQKLLGFLGSRDADGSASDINEWVIATTVFGRSQEFDSATDTTVRSSIYRLRSKLRDYYTGDGRNDPVVVEIPKGHHIPIFTRRQTSELLTETAVLSPVEPSSFAADPPPFYRTRPTPLRWASLAIIGAAVALAIYWGMLKRMPRNNVASIQR